MNNLEGLDKWIIKNVIFIKNMEDGKVTNFFIIFLRTIYIVSGY